jgi:DNA polymerase III delta prime subunit
MSHVFDKEITDKQPFATSLIESAIKKNRLAHAYLLTGRALSEKWIFAQQLSIFLNCSSIKDWATDRACRFSQRTKEEYCLNCRWIGESKHPQAWLQLTSEGNKSGKIPVEKARQISSELAKCSDYFRTVIVEDASQEAFHRPAANALLKTIEDPGDRCIFLLFSDREEDVLPTVVSRCQVVPLQNSGDSDTALWSAANNQSAKPPEAKELEALKEAFERIFAAKDSRETARALEFSKDIQAALDETEDSTLTIDFAVNLEVGRLGKRSVEDKQTAGYLADLLWLAQESKLQIEQYVSAKAAIETFVLSWWQLRKTAKC